VRLRNSSWEDRFVSSRRRTTKVRTPQLGDLTFDDWYETPVFETEPDERLEHLATSRRAPVRLIGNAMLRLAPDRTPRPIRPARPVRPTGAWRERAGRLLDRWADMEAASQQRLEELVLPKRWRG
jgi:hypothetical protein